MFICELSKQSTEPEHATNYDKGYIFRMMPNPVTDKKINNLFKPDPAMRSQQTSDVFDFHAPTPTLMGIEEFKVDTGNHDHSLKRLVRAPNVKRLNYLEETEI